VFFANMGGGHFEGQPFEWFARKDKVVTPVIGYKPGEFFGTQEPIYGPPRTISGLRLVDARASYGVGLETFALGFPVHIDWSWKTLFNRDWEDAIFSAPCLYDGQRYCGGSEEFRKPKVSLLDWLRLLVGDRAVVGPPSGGPTKGRRITRRPFALYKRHARLLLAASPRSRVACRTRAADDLDDFVNAPSGSATFRRRHRRREGRRRRPNRRLRPGRPRAWHRAAAGHGVP
jgi:hypothetical protein